MLSIQERVNRLNMKQRKNKILVVGAGGVGAYFGGRLAQGGVDVAVVCRSDYESVLTSGYDIKSIAGDFIFKPAAVYRSCEECPSPPDFLLITTKALPEIDLTSIIYPVVGPETTIVLLQNGIDIEEPIAESFRDNELISGIAYIGVTRSGAGKVYHKGSGHLKFGVYPSGISRKLKELAALFNEVGVECEAVDDIVLFRWIKLVWNMPYNPVSVLAGGVDTREISESPLLEGLCAELMREVCAVAAACGKPLPPDIVEKNLNYTRSFPPYKTSMLVDYDNGRPLETDVIVGNLLRLARQHQVPVPRTETIYALLTVKGYKNIDK